LTGHFENWMLNNSGKSDAWFPDPPLSLQTVSVKLIDSLVSRAISLGENVRMCLHEQGTIGLQCMIIAQHSHLFDLPKNADAGGKLFNILKGELQLVTFDDGRFLVASSSLLNKDVPVGFVRQGRTYVDVPRSEISVHLEIASSISTRTTPDWVKGLSRSTINSIIP